MNVTIYIKYILDLVSVKSKVRKRVLSELFMNGRTVR